jgi:2-polyprenyl-3-methyl-5-hydroxy-6-metoxy-1,4-benzoquinol methylase
MEIGSRRSRATSREAGSGAVTSCCTEVLSGKFDLATATADRERYRTSGPDATTRLLRDALIGTGRSGHLLDIGAGIGVLGLELLKAGIATRVTAVEAAPAYVAGGMQEAEARGVSAEVQYIAGDFIELSDSMPMADLVTLDRVVCCYAHYEALLRHAAGRARGALALSYPKDAWYFRLAYELRNRVRAWRGQRFQFYAHSAAAMAQVLERAGWRRVARKGTLVWWIDAYVRDAT